MIALKLLFQSLAGVGSVLVCAGGGYYVMKEGNEDNFYLVSATAPSTSNVPSLDLWTELPTTKTVTTSTILSSSSPAKSKKTQQNYKCLSTEANNTKADDSCLLYSLTPNNGTKSIEISEIQTFIKDTSKTSTLVTKTEEKSTITINKFFLLKASKKLHTTWTFDGTKTIKLVEKTAATADTNKTYSTLTVHANISSESVEGKTNWVIAKSDSAEASTTISPAASTQTFKCTFDTKNTYNDCSLIALTSYSETTAFNFSSLTITSPQTASSTIAAEKYFLIKSVGSSSFELKDLINKKVKYVDTTTTTVKTTIFTIKKAAFILPTSGTITEAIIIK